MVMRLLAPFLLRYFANKMQDRFEQQFKQHHQSQQSKAQEEGKVTIEKTKTSAQSKSNNLGEYVDFEEVDE
tara:strand:- start:60 stop:272 length:213 start_codon:yes stop_codon:yes gene_type:complete